ncbi:MAG: energy transducer TonB [Cytophaga sp.]|uniref:energy transducer TonB n=1 Tax=Cytophaga sp. TaxID=29535 RepID=UPI003F8144C4
MKFSVFLLATSLLFCLQAKSQVNPAPPKANEKSELIEEPIEEPTPNDGEIYVMVDVLPEYKDGGEGAFIQYVTSYVHKHAVHPKDSTVAVTGNMFIQFVIEKDGSVSDVSIYSGKGINPAYDQAAIDAIKKTQWKPASRNGMSVRYRKMSKFRFY